MAPDGKACSVSIAFGSAQFCHRLEDGAPLQQQIRERLIHSVATGILVSGARAGVETLARRLGVSRNTVLIVYQQLTAEGIWSRANVAVCSSRAI